MKHLIISRMKFNDTILLNSYLKIAKEILIPCLKSQTNQNFEWCLFINDIDVEYVKNYLDYNFLSFNKRSEIIEYIKKNNINIQTRHDIDDFMSQDYIDKIQDIYNKNIENFDTFLIYAQPTKINYKTKEESKTRKYFDYEPSMFLSLCQKNANYYIYEYEHGKMTNITKNIIELPEGYTKWIIHGNNISCKNGRIKF